MSVIIDTTMSEVESVMKYARYGANNCMIGNGWEIKELVRCKDCIWWRDEDCSNPVGLFLPDEDCFCNYGYGKENR